MRLTHIWSCSHVCLWVQALVFWRCRCAASLAVNVDLRWGTRLNTMVYAGRAPEPLWHLNHDVFLSPSWNSSENSGNHLYVSADKWSFAAKLKYISTTHFLCAHFLTFLLLVVRPLMDGCESSESFLGRVHVVTLVAIVCDSCICWGQKGSTQHNSVAKWKSSKCCVRPAVDLQLSVVVSLPAGPWMSRPSFMTGEREPQTVSNSCVTFNN